MEVFPKIRNIISPEELNVFIRSEKTFLRIFFALLVVGLPALYLTAGYVPWESNRNIATLFLIAIGLSITLDRIIIPAKYSLGIQIFEILISVAGIFGIIAVTGLIRSPINVFYVIAIAFSFFMIGRNFGFLVFWLIILLFVVELILPQWRLVYAGHPEALKPYLPFFFSYAIGMTYTVAVMLFVSETLIRLEEKRVVAIEKAKYLQILVTNLQELDREKSEFITLVAHHFRTPLSRVKWAVDAILGEKPSQLSEQQKIMIDEVNRTNDDLTILLHKILTVSKWDLKQIEYNAVLNLSALVTEQTSKWQKFAQEKAVQIDADIPPRIIIEANEEGIKEVMDVVLENAILYNKPNGTARIEIVPGSEEARVIIKDTGLGIPADEQKLLFTEFFRASNVRSMDGIRRGLSLFIARKIIQGHGGKISIESIENVGTTVTISLPLKQEKSKMISL